MDKKNIAIELNGVDLLKHALFKDYNFPKEIAHLNLTQERILMTVKNSSNLTMVTIARAIGLEKGPFSQTVDKLAEMQLLERVRQVSDKRKVFLKLTEKGEELAKIVEDSMRLHFNEKIKMLTTDEIREIFQALDSIQKIAKILISK
ncbi:MarR family winged helix-turn-helix transcriptional regulator [Sphingobacterium bovistauri]|uniref:MarR family transcriptional regulator n=1 Tax=Sphingobacterium bovistauri TaxID=2781959 RepID=A0ABS7ZCF6_9SPHI|nr:MarR family transcriptional regulator [Sphingobacterium bovistauri]MCA5006404.1 MarR family transcriptional regulator [Sphingobacterium bovistauri]